jgi:hypothetical protein
MCRLAVSKMTVQEAVQRGINFFGIAVMAIVNLAVASIIFTETDLADKGDDILAVVIGLTGIGWYLIGRNRFKRSYVPLILIIVSFIVKLSTALFGEAGDPAAQGDDIGISIVFLLAAIAMAWVMVRNRNAAATS